MSAKKIFCPSCGTPLTIHQPLTPGALLRCGRCNAGLRVPAAPKAQAPAESPPTPPPVAGPAADLAPAAAPFDFGSVPLPVLEQRMNRFIADGGVNPSTTPSR